MITTEELIQKLHNFGYRFKKDGAALSLDDILEVCTSSGSRLTARCDITTDDQYVMNTHKFKDENFGFKAVRNFTYSNKMSGFEQVVHTFPISAGSFRVENANIPDSCEYSCVTDNYFIRECELSNLAILSNSKKTSSVLVYRSKTPYTLQHLKYVKKLVLAYVSVATFEYVPEYCEIFSYAYSSKNMPKDVPYALRLMLMEGLTKIVSTQPGDPIPVLDIISHEFARGDIYSAAAALVEAGFNEAAKV